MKTAGTTWRIVLAGAVVAAMAGWQAAPPSTPKPPKAPKAPSAPAAPRSSKTPDRDDGDAPAPKSARPAGFWFGTPKAPEKKPGTIRIAAYNVENVFDEKDDPSLQGEFDDIKMATKATRLAAIADAIKRLDADVISIEEIESLECLQWFRDKYLKGLGYDHAYSEDVGYFRGVEQAFLSRYPITAHRTWVTEDLSDMAEKRTGEGWAKAKADQGKKFQRSPLMVTVDVKGYPLTLISVHNKAGGREFEYHRESEALQQLEFIKEMLTKDPGANIAIMGDFNATPGQRTPKVFSGAGMRSAYDFRGVKQGNTKDLYTTHDSGRALDFIFMSPGLAEDAVDSSFFVLGTVHPPSTYKWQDDPDKNGVPEGYASDHYPVAIDITPAARPKTPTPAPASSAPAAPAGVAPAAPKRQ